MRGKTQIGLANVVKLVGAGVGNSAFIKLTSQITPRGTSSTVYYAPRWMVRALRAGIDHKLVAKAVRSQKTRRQINATLRLSGRGTL